MRHRRHNSGRITTIERIIHVNESLIVRRVQFGDAWKMLTTLFDSMRPFRSFGRYKMQIK